MSTDWDSVELTKSASNFIDNSGSPDTLEELPGIGPSIAKALAKDGIKNPNALIGNFFLCNLDRDKFKAFLREALEGTKGVNDSHINQTVQAIYLKFRMFA